ncbi:MAG: DNA/RNA non-specific endonuclease [Niabella sp.]
MKIFLRFVIYPFVTALILFSCSKVPTAITPVEKPLIDTVVMQENFEWNEKDDYTNQLLVLKTGNWIFSNALLGSSSADQKNNTQSARLVADGSVSMVQPVWLGKTTTVEISVALYGTGTSGKWVLMASNNGGAFEKVGDTVITTSATLTQLTINYNKSGWTSFAIQKGAGASLNIDDIAITTKTTTNIAGYIASPAYVFNYSTPDITPPVSTGVVGKDSLQYPVSGDNSNLLLGNPSNAVQDATTAPNNYLMINRYYTCSYSRDRATPNWVSWHLQKSNYGTVSRTDNYQPNPDLPEGWYKVMASSYNGSGYNRGHNCPSGDRTSTKEANYAVFLMTNMIPQTSDNNGLTWNNLEVYTRTLTDAGNECYVIMGSYGNKGTIDNGKITIPSNIWKVVVVLPTGNNDLSRITASTRVICVNTPNDNGVSSEWRNYRVSLKAIEDATGYNLLSNIDAGVKAALLNKVDNL